MPGVFCLGRHLIVFAAHGWMAVLFQGVRELFGSWRLMNLAKIDFETLKSVLSILACVPMSDFLHASSPPASRFAVLAA